jgi:hypothetical protein
VLLHNPTNFPNVEDQYFQVPLDRDVMVGIKPMLMNTSEELRSYSPERRQCFFAIERHLQHFSIYTQENCDFECYTNYTLNKCNCTAYYMPREFKFFLEIGCAHTARTIWSTDYIWHSCSLFEAIIHNYKFGASGSVTLSATWVFPLTLQWFI